MDAASRVAYGNYREVSTFREIGHLFFEVNAKFLWTFEGQKVKGQGEKLRRKFDGR